MRRQARRHGRGAPDAVGADVALLLVALAAGLGLGRLTVAPGSARVVVPLAACVVGGHLVVSVLSRLAARRGVAGAVPAAFGAAGGVVGVALIASWTILRSTTRAGIPTPTTWRSMLSWFSEAGAVITRGPTPLPVTTGVILCVALGAGLVAVCGRALWARHDGGGRPVRYPLAALVPASGLFAYTALLSSDRDRATATVGLLVASSWFVVAADRAVGRGTRQRSRGASPKAWRAAPGRPVGVLGAVLVVGLATAVTAATAPALAAMDVHAFPHPPVVVAGAGPAISSGSVALLDDVGATSVSADKSVVFVASSPIPTYWQVASLSHFDGAEWSPTGDTLGSTLPSPTVPTFSATIAVAYMFTTLLPAPPDAEKVLGGTGLWLEAGEVESPTFSAPGMVYSVTARVPAGPSTGGSFAALYGAVPPAELAPYLAMPSVNPDVVSLARRIVSGDDTPLAEADALVRWFDSGRFRYTTRPPVSADPDPLSSFLLHTHAGFCQQFAGAFAALARLDGLPTRVAVGYSTGSAGAPGVYRVVGADAHTWPEVYLGPGVGWVSFEPTPGSAGTPPSVRQGNAASAGSAARALPHDETATTAPRRGPSPSDLLPARAGRHSPAGRSDTWTAAGMVTALVVVVVGAVALMSRRRTRERLRGRVRRQWERRWEPMARRRRARHGLVPAVEILASWRRTGAALERAALGRRPSETPDEHAARLAAAMERRARMSPFVLASMAPSSHVDVDDYRELAALATKAVYGRDGCSDADAERAHDLELAVRAMLDADAEADTRVPAGA